MVEHETIRLLAASTHGECLVLGDRKVIAVNPTSVERLLIIQSCEEGRELGVVGVLGGEERVILFGRLSSIPSFLVNIAIRELNPRQGSVVYFSHTHWDPEADIRPSDADCAFANDLQGTFKGLNLVFRVACGSPDLPLAFQYLPLPEESHNGW